MTTEGTMAKEVIEGTWEETQAVFEMCKKNNVHVRWVTVTKNGKIENTIEFTSHNWLALQRCVNAVKRNRQETLDRAVKANLKKFAR